MISYVTYGSRVVCLTFLGNSLRLDRGWNQEYSLVFKRMGISGRLGDVMTLSDLRCVKRVTVIVVFLWRQLWEMLVVALDIWLPDKIPSCSPDSNLIYPA